jgi:HlyD family secretion protein
MRLAVQCRAVEKDFGRGDTRIRALRGVDLRVPFGELTMLVGPSGCGKTTLLSVIAGVLNATGSEVAHAEAQVHRVEADLGRLTMYAPIDGEILQLNVRAGEYAQVGQLPKPLLVMGEVRQLHVRADIDENDAWRVQSRGKAEAAERGNGSRRAALEFVRFEPYVIPKKSLTGDSTERVDTRVLQAIYRFTDGSVPFYVGQQMDIFIEASTQDAAQ